MGTRNRSSNNRPLVRVYTQSNTAQSINSLGGTTYLWGTSPLIDNYRAYNTSTGIFRAPFTGIYEFYTSYAAAEAVNSELQPVPEVRCDIFAVKYPANSSLGGFITPNPCRNSAYRTNGITDLITAVDGVDVFNTGGAGARFRTHQNVQIPSVNTFILELLSGEGLAFEGAGFSEGGAGLFPLNAVRVLKITEIAK